MHLTSSFNFCHDGWVFSRWKTLCIIPTSYYLVRGNLINFSPNLDAWDFLCIRMRKLSPIFSLKVILIVLARSRKKKKKEYYPSREYFLIRLTRLRRKHYYSSLLILHSMRVLLVIWRIGGLQLPLNYNRKHTTSVFRLTQLGVISGPQ